MSANSFSQKEDFVWFSGGSHFGGGSINFFKFNDSSFIKDFVVLPNPLMVRDGSGKATIADNEGNLLFYTDGFDVYNLHHRIMEKGDSVFAIEGQLLNYYSFPSGVNIPDWTIILPSLEKENEYYLFYLGIKDDEISPSQFRGSGLNYSIIDISKNDGLGEVIEKNLNLIDLKSNHGSLQAIRHANGRDWWILVREMLNARWHVFFWTTEV